MFALIQFGGERGQNNALDTYLVTRFDSCEQDDGVPKIPRPKVRKRLKIIIIVIIIIILIIITLFLQAVVKPPGHVVDGVPYLEITSGAEAVGIRSRQGGEFGKDAAGVVVFAMV